MAAIRKLEDRFTEADIDNEIVIMRLDNGTFYSLTGTGASIWRLIDGDRDREALVIAAASEFEGRKNEIADDVGELLSRLKETGLLAND